MAWRGCFVAWLVILIAGVGSCGFCDILYGRTTECGAATISATIFALAITGFLAKRHERLAQLGDLLRAHLAERLAQAPDRARVQLGDARFVHANLCANLPHCHFAVIVEADHFALAPRERLNRGTDAVTCFTSFVRAIGRLGLRGHERRRQRRFVDVLAGGERRRGFDSC